MTGQEKMATAQTGVKDKDGRDRLTKEERRERWLENKEERREEKLEAKTDDSLSK